VNKPTLIESFMEQKHSKINTMLLGIISVLGPIAWALAMHMLNNVELSVNEVKANMMPRQEVIVILESLKDRITKQEAATAEARLEIKAIELEIVKIGGSRKP